MLGVGTVVMNRVESDKYPNTVCEVVGQKNQFAPGVMSREMKEGQSLARAQRMATKVLEGARHRRVGDALFFHTAGHNFPYRNMHYVAIAGGNAFYERRNAGNGRRNTTQIEIARATPPERRPSPVGDPVPMPVGRAGDGRARSRAGARAAGHGPARGRAAGARRRPSAGGCRSASSVCAAARS